MQISIRTVEYLVFFRDDDTESWQYCQPLSSPELCDTWINTNKKENPDRVYTIEERVIYSKIVKTVKPDDHLRTIKRYHTYEVKSTCG